MHPYKQLFRPMTFCTPAGVANAELHGDEIVGVQKNPLTEVRAANGVALCARFANWPNDPKGVLSFTKRYGVLRERPHPGAGFSFRTADWQLDQQLLRREWDYFAYISDKWGSVNDGGFSQSAIPVADGEELVHRDGKLEYRTQSLLRLLRLELASFSFHGLRKCRRPGCKTPYFVTNNLKTRYCCDACGQWAQREWKKKWWEDRGAEWRQRRAKTKKKRLQKRKWRRRGATPERNKP